jgi:hypothetical protein
LPAVGIAQHQSLTEDIEARRARRQAFRPVCPISAAGNQNADRVPKIGERRSSFRMSSQDFQNCDLKAQYKPSRRQIFFFKESRLSYLPVAVDVYRVGRLYIPAKCILFRCANFATGRGSSFNPQSRYQA